MQVKKQYVMFGFKLTDIDMTAYIGNDFNLVEDMQFAKRFLSWRKRGQKGFGTPNQWLEYVNADPDLNKGYKFHLVQVII